MSADSYQALQDLARENRNWIEVNNNLIKENKRLREYNEQLEQRLADAGQILLVLREICANCEIETTLQRHRQATDSHPNEDGA